MVTMYTIEFDIKNTLPFAHTTHHVLERFTWLAQDKSIISLNMNQSAFVVEINGGLCEEWNVFLNIL